MPRTACVAIFHLVCGFVCLSLYADRSLRCSNDARAPQSHTARRRRAPRASRQVAAAAVYVGLASSSSAAAACTTRSHKAGLLDCHRIQTAATCWRRRHPCIYGVTAAAAAAVSLLRNTVYIVRDRTDVTADGYTATFRFYRQPCCIQFSVDFGQFGSASIDYEESDVSATTATI
jgi:hypothetical protein